MKGLLSVFAGLVVGMAHAQTVNWDTAFASCSQEAAAFDRWAVERSMYWENEGTIATWRHVRRNYKSSTIDVPSTLQALQSNRSVLSKGPHPGAALDACVMQAALNQLQSGSTQSSATASSRSSQGNVSASSSGRDRADLAAHHCVSRADNRLRNNCSQTIKVNFCTEDGGTYSSCGSNNLPFSIFNPGDSIYVSAPKAYWFACATPARPSEVEYLPGRGLRGACTE